MAAIAGTMNGRRMEESKSPREDKSTGCAMRRARRGFTLIELTAASVILAMAAAVVLQLIVLSGASRRSTSQQRLAWREASNCLEAFTIGGYDAATGQRAAAYGLSQRAISALPQGKLDVTDETMEDALKAKRISVEVAWQTPRGRRRTVRLTTFVYPELPGR